MHPTQLVDSLRRAFRWHRRAFAALFAAVAVLAVLSSFSARDADGTEVLVAARAIAGGAVVAASDLQVVRLPASGVPEGAITDPEQAVGRVVVAEVPTRRVLTGSDLLGAAGLVGSGMVALPVRFGEAGTVGLLDVGNRIDILGPTAGTEAYGVVAAAVRVVAIPKGEDTGLLDGGQAELVLVEVSSAQAAAIAAAASVSSLSFALR